MKKNCWEIKNCGRQPGGKNADKYGICPATVNNEFDGVNGGTNGGRFCWVVAGTYCNGAVQGTYAMKLMDCINCEVLKKIHFEESREFKLTPNEGKEKNE
ncbi:MAG: hypothetical protein A2W91_17370 [Bacteroidetes bacterium GWF2_38_335]|nr:MAG: hypothetical protein A2W91_17370 [Bacteroidetes bacterium GWF2_38_335]OFY78635.1 MAG: hypothetical protein A2281_16395 [Bacteroidetes bacterium RIFOXYA12_FULL_38_20]HBS88369.1 hypothetical protein [Bacteroidales bacterium]